MISGNFFRIFEIMNRLNFKCIDQNFESQIYEFIDICVETVRLFRNFGKKLGTPSK